MIADYFVPGCSGKKQYTEDQCNRAADRLSEKEGKRARSYKCPICGHWHVGHHHRKWRLAQHREQLDQDLSQCSESVNILLAEIDNALNTGTE